MMLVQNMLIRQSLQVWLSSWQDVRAGLWAVDVPQSHQGHRWSVGKVTTLLFPAAFPHPLCQSCGAAEDSWVSSENI